MQSFDTTDWECAQCGRALQPGDKACPSCGSADARRRPIRSGRRVNWAVGRIVAFLVALGAVAFLVASQFRPPPSPTAAIVRHFLHGQELLDQGRPQEAIAELETVTRLAPDSIGGHHELAKAYDRAGRHADALREMRQTLRLTLTDETATEGIRDSEEADLRFELATLLAKNGEFVEAVAELERAARRDESLERSADYHIALGIAQAGRGRPDAARDALAGATEMSPEMTAKAITEWLADRPDGPEAPLLERMLLAGGSPSANSPSIASPLELPAREAPATQP